jgi:CubicO group peptidase (beta-lactamase class C family)
MVVKTKLSTICLSLAIVMLGMAVGPATLPTTAIATSQTNPGVADRIRRVENGLLPVVVIKGQSAPMKIADRMAFHKVPGVSVAVINDGKIEWARGYGAVEAGGNKPITPDTLFLAGSISKPVAAMAALRLVEQGKLDLDEDINQKLKSWKVPENEFTKDKKVTLRGLLSHSAGMTVHGFPGYAVDAPMPTLVQVLNGEKPANTGAIRVDVVPGSLWRYSGGGYTVMQQTLVDVTGKSFPDLTRELVLAPIGMKQSGYENPLPKSREAEAATAHVGNNSQPLKGRWHIYPEMAAAGLWTTPSDLARYAIEVQRAVAGKSKVMSSKMAEQMLTVQKGNYGLGPALEGHGQAARFSHGGVDEGFEAYFVAYSKTGQGAVVMMNANRAIPLAMEIIRGIAKEYNWPAYLEPERSLAKVDSAVYKKYEGTYEFEGGTRLTVLVEDGKLFLKWANQPRFELFPESETKFFRDNGATFNFAMGEQGRAVSVTRELSGQIVKAKRVD